MNIDAPSSNTIAAKTKRGKTVHMVVTERVKEVAKTYYACDSINGAELEDEVGSGCLGSHWEERTMFDELMSPLADGHFAEIEYQSLLLLSSKTWVGTKLTTRWQIRCNLVKRPAVTFWKRNASSRAQGYPLMSRRIHFALLAANSRVLLILGVLVAA